MTSLTTFHSRASKLGSHFASSHTPLASPAGHPGGTQNATIIGGGRPPVKQITGGRPGGGRDRAGHGCVPRVTVALACFPSRE